MKRKKHAHSPLLYVDQPKLISPKVPMQEKAYGIQAQSSKKKELLKNSRRKDIRKKWPSNLRRYSAVKIEENEYDDLEKEILKQVEVEEQDDLSFQQMSIHEKLEYVAREPKFISKIRCEIKTKEKKYKGIVERYADNVVHMNIGKQSLIKSIPVDEILEVNMLGLKS